MAITLEVFCAMAGNWAGESKLNSGIWYGAQEISYSNVPSTSLDTAFGLGQWTGSRRRGLAKYIISNNSTEFYSLEYQGLYVIYEGYWVSNRGDIDSFNEFINDTSHSLSDLTYMFLANWECPSTDSTELASLFEERYEYAVYYYDYIQEHWNDNITEYYYDYNYWSAYGEKALNNLIYLYQLLCGVTEPIYGTGGTGSVTDYNSNSGSGNSSSNNSYEDIIYSKTKLKPYIYINQLRKIKRKQYGIYLHGKRY